jgi:hypothetical protein
VDVCNGSPKCQKFQFVFDESTNEFQFTWPSEDERYPGHLVIYHCPFCGGTAPESKRHLLFAVVSDTETKRLNQVLADIKTAKDAVEKLGPPDQDLPHGTSVQTLEHDGNPPETHYFRTLRYKQLSDTVDVEFTVHQDDRVSVAYYGKLL